MNSRAQKVWDMTFCVLRASAALLALSRVRDKYLGGLATLRP